MADRVDYYRGYGIAIYHLGRPNVRATIQERNGLPPIHDSALEKSIPAAVAKAKELIDQKLAARTSN
jgi:hypothetical protein